VWLAGNHASQEKEEEGTPSKIDFSLPCSQFDYRGPSKHPPFDV